MMPFTPDGNLFYRVTGAGPRTVVFLHGAAGSGLLFGNQFQAFRKEARCYFLDLPGHGASRMFPSRPAMETYAIAVIEFLAGLGRPADLLGHSMGGAIGLEIALSRPDLLRRVILAGTGCRFPFSREILKWLNDDYDRALDRIARHCFTESADAGYVETARAQMARTDPEIVRADFLACEAFDRCADLREIRVPAVVICGEKDRMTPLGLSQHIVDLVPESALEVIPGGSHLCMLEQPDMFNRILIESL